MVVLYIINSVLSSAGFKIANDKAGLLTRSDFDRLPVLWDSGIKRVPKSCVAFAGRNLQQRELSPIFTAFPFNLVGVRPFENRCQCKDNNILQSGYAGCKKFL